MRGLFGELRLQFCSFVAREVGVLRHALTAVHEPCAPFSAILSDDKNRWSRVRVFTGPNIRWKRLCIA